MWTLNGLPNVGQTADGSVSLPLLPSEVPPPEFPDLADGETTFMRAGGDFFVAEHDGNIVGMGGFRPNVAGQAEVLRVRVHPAMRRRGVGRQLMGAIENAARQAGLSEMFLDTALNQPDAVAFYQGLGYQELGRRTEPDWSWTLVYFGKHLSKPGGATRPKAG